MCRRLVPTHLEVDNHSIVPGEGIKAHVDGKECYLGNKKMLQCLGLYSTLSVADTKITDSWAEGGGTVVFLSIQGIVAGAFCVSDNVRPESKQVVTDLTENLGIEVVMLTGDNKDAAIAIGKQVGLNEDQIKSQLRPEDKLAYITETVERNKSEGKCCLRLKQDNAIMVGDGVNDAPALALADVSVAMGNGAALAMETSDVTLMDSNLEKLVWTINMGKRTRQCIVQNVLFSLISKAIVVSITFVGHISLQATLWAAIATDVGGAMVVTLNAMRLLPRKKDGIDLVEKTEITPPKSSTKIVDVTTSRHAPPVSFVAQPAQHESLPFRSSIQSIKMVTNPELLRSTMLSVRAIGGTGIRSITEEPSDSNSAEEMA